MYGEFEFDVFRLRGWLSFSASVFGPRKNISAGGFAGSSW